MMRAYIMVHMVLAVFAVRPPPLPKNEGHFFYIDMNKGGPEYKTTGSTKLMKYVDMLVGNHT